MTAAAAAPARKPARPPRVRRRRSTELGLVALAGGITVWAYILASLGKSASLPADVLPFLGVMLGLLLAGHVALRRLAPRADQVLFPIAGLLNGFGYVFIARLDRDLAALQALWSVLGVVAFTGTLLFVRRVRDLERYRYTALLGGLALLLLPLAPGIGRVVNGARLWVRVGPVSFQPGELAKLALAVFFAAYLYEKRELLTLRIRRGHLPQVRHLGPLFLAWGASLVVMTMQRDLGSSLLFFTLFVTMVWVATGSAAWLAMGAGLFAVGAVGAWTVFTHVQQRVQVWLDPWPVADGTGFQIVQALYAFGSGGLTGSGLSLGSPGKIPAAETDFIFAVIGEELGFLGTSAVLCGYVVLVGVGLRVALRADRDFEKLLAAGLTTILGVQTFIILGGVTRLVPLTGITLPFISYGGSSLIANYVLLALLLRLSEEEDRSP